MMKKRIPLMCALTLAVSLSSCAPTVTGPNGQAYVADVKVGGQSALVQRVALADLNDQTPASSYVELSQCSGGVISVRDVRQLGVETTTQACKDAVKKTVGGFGTAMVGLIVVFSAVFIYGVKSIANSVSNSH